MRIDEIAPGQRKNFDRKWLQTPGTFEKFWTKVIEPNCSQILEEYRAQNLVCFRGEDGQNLIFRGASRIDRPVRDSNQLLSKIFDQCLISKGFSVIRSNSVFASSDKVTASEFGKVYIFLPINGYKFTYINRRDLVLDVMQDLMVPGMYHYIKGKYEFYAQQHGIKWSFNSYFLREKNCRSPQAIVELLQTMFPNDMTIKRLTADTLFNCDSIINRFDPTNQQLGVALKNNYEIMFKCQYYAISLDAFFKLVGEQLGFPIIQ